MPIYGITERGLRFPRLGSIRKGEQIPMMKDGQPIKRGNEVVMRPIERPYFVFSCDAMTAQYIPDPGLSKKAQKEAEIKHQEMEYKLQQDTLEKIYSVYGTNQITELNVFLPYPEAHNAFSFWLEAYVANQKVAQSDERIITFLFDTLTGEVLVRRGMVVRHSSNPKSVAGSLVKEIPIGGVLPYEKDMIVGETRTKNEPIVMKPMGRLNVVIPELKQAATWMVFTGSWADIGSIYSAVETIDQIQKSMGQPANTVPLILRRVPVQSSYEDENGKTHKKTSYNIEAKIMSNAVKGLLTMYEETPFMMQLSSGHEEDYDIPDEALEPVEAQVEEYEEQPVEERSISGKISNLDAELIQEVIKREIFQNDFGAKAVMSQCAWKEATFEKFVKWAEVYRDNKNYLLGEGWKGAEATQEAVKQTNAGNILGEQS